LKETSERSLNDSSESETKFVEFHRTLDEFFLGSCTSRYSSPNLWNLPRNSPFIFTFSTSQERQVLYLYLFQLVPCISCLSLSPRRLSFLAFFFSHWKNTSNTSVSKFLLLTRFTCEVVNCVQNHLSAHERAKHRQR
jgi:hypothetical protein